MLREFFTEALVSRVVDALGLPDAALRATLVATQVTGLVMVRYVIRLEPLASLPSEQLIAAVAPNVQRYLTGDLGLRERAHRGAGVERPVG
jgi:Tetracyclin repressor-like, C-terminal domain